MKRIWNALRYGDKETRKCIGGVIFFSVLAIVLIVISGIFNLLYLFAIGMVAGVIGIIISQTFTLVDDDFVAETDQKGNKNTIRSVAVDKDGVSSRQAEAREHKERNRTEEGLEKDSLEKKEEEISDREQRRYKEEVFARYNEQVFRKMKRKYHMRRDHRPIIIDYSKSYHIKECPAFIWRIHNKVFLLLLEEEPRRISISRELIRHMDYVPNVRANRLEEYVAFEKESLVKRVFKEYLPDYFDSKKKNINYECKHLYMIYPDIWLSNRSAADVMDLLCLNFMPEDKTTKSDKINGYFKRIYAAHILYKDHVYSITEYKTAVEKALGEMCFAEIPDREFAITLENLVKSRLISWEYAEHYRDLKEKVSPKKK